MAASSISIPIPTFAITGAPTTGSNLLNTTVGSVNLLAPQQAVANFLNSLVAIPNSLVTAAQTSISAVLGSFTTVGNNLTLGILGAPLGLGTTAAPSSTSSGTGIIF